MIKSSFSDGQSLAGSTTSRPMESKGVDRGKSNRMTLRQLAAMADTTPASISRALTGRPGISAGLRKKIRKLADEHGYVPNQQARNMVSGSTTFIGFMASDITNPFYVMVFKILEGLCRQDGLSLLIADSKRSEERELQNTRECQRLNTRGLVIFPVSDLDSNTQNGHLELLVKQGIPIVALGYLKMSGVSTVVTEEWIASTNIVKSLREVGHRRFLLVHPGASVSVAAGMRISAIRSVITEDLLEMIDSDETGWQDSAVSAITRNNDRPTAIIAINDNIALQLYRPLLQRGIRIPEDVSLAAFGSTIWAPHVYPSLTLSEADATVQAETAYRILKQRIADPETPDEHILIPQTFIARESIGPVLGKPS